MKAASGGKNGGRAEVASGTRSKSRKAKTETVTFKCRREYKEWLAAFARRERDTTTRLIDLGLKQLAEKVGYEPPPDR